MALAMPFDYDQETIEYIELSKWTEKSITYRLINLNVKKMVELD